MFRLINHLLSLNSIYGLSIFVYTFIIVIYNYKIKKHLKEKRQLRFLYFIPFMISTIHFIIYNFQDGIDYYIMIFGIMFLSSILIIGLQFFHYRSNKIIFKLYIFITIIVATIGVLKIEFYTIGSEELHNYSYLSYSKSFEKMLNNLEKEYVLNEYRNINYKELKSKYYELIKIAEKNKDEELYYNTLYKFVSEFKDAHFYMECNNETCLKSISNEFENRDYGFGTILTTDEKLISINVDKNSDAYEKGLRDGMIITHKDGIPIKELIKKIVVINDKNPVKKNSDIYKSIFLFNQGNEQTTITIDNNYILNINENTNINKENSISKTFNKIYYFDDELNNLDTKMVSNNIGYIKIDSEEYKSVLGALTTINDNSSFISKIIDTKLEKLKKDGMEKLIIDIRSNTGGYISESSAIASLFLEDDFEFAKSSKYNSNFYDTYKVKKNGKYKNIKVIVLVNSDTVSAGDALAYLLSKSNNVKLMGYTTTNNSCQSIGGKIFLTKGSISISYPIYNTLDTENNIFIDANNEGAPTIKLDYEIPIKYENINDIFYNEKDYVLKQAISFLSRT